MYRPGDRVWYTATRRGEPRHAAAVFVHYTASRASIVVALVRGGTKTINVSPTRLAPRTRECHVDAVAPRFIPPEPRENPPAEGG